MQQELHAAREPSATPQTERVIVGSGNGHLLWFDLTDEGDAACQKRAAVRWLPFLPGAVADAGAGGRRARQLALPGDALGSRASLGAPSASGGTGPAYVTFESQRRVRPSSPTTSAAVCRCFARGAPGGAVSSQRTGQNPHAIVCSPDNRHALVPCLGSDYVAVYRFDEASGALEPAGTAAAPLGTGPRHLTFDATGQHRLRHLRAHQRSRRLRVGTLAPAGSSSSAWYRRSAIPPVAHPTPPRTSSFTLQAAPSTPPTAATTAWPSSPSTAKVASLCNSASPPAANPATSPSTAAATVC